MRHLWPIQDQIEAKAAKPSTNPLSAYRDNPQKYARDILGLELTPDQDAMLGSILSNRRTIVKASHAVGKTFTAAVAASWWYDCWQEHISYITAPTWPQALGLTFKQLKTLRRARKLSGVILDTGIVRDENKDREGAHYVRALNAERGEGFQGEHSAPILIVIEEGVGVPKYIWDAAGGLMTHPECFIGDTEVSASEVKAATSRFYQGRVIKITTAHGRELTVTPNHPILTLRGWVSAQRLSEGDQLIASRNVQAVTSRIVPNKENVPTAISEVFAALSRASSNARWKGSRLQFHRDGTDSEVRIVYSDSFLRNKDQRPSEHKFGEPLFPVGDSGCAPLFFRPTNHAPARSMKSRTHEFPSPRSAQLAHARDVPFTDISSLSAGRSQRRSDGRRRNAVLCSKLIKRFAAQIFRRYRRGCAPRFTATASTQNYSVLDKVSSKRFPVSSDLARQMIARFPGDITPDQVLNVRNDSFSGQVYNLHTDTEWYFANGIIAHNCRMFVIGNPTEESNEFGLAAESVLFNTMSISALNHPNITAELACEPPPFPGAVRLQWLYEMLGKECDQITELTEDAFEFVAIAEIKKALSGQPANLSVKSIYMPTAYFQGRVLGEFPTQADQQVIPKSWLKFQRTIEVVGIPELGCDVARFGDDRTTKIARIDGAILWAKELRKFDNEAIIVSLREDAKELGSKFSIDPKKVPIKIDVTGGLGTGPYDRLLSEGYTVSAINSSNKAFNEEQYPNRRSELWFDTRDRAKDKRLDLSRLPRDVRQRLEKELSCAKYVIRSGRKVVEDKADIKKRLGYSPDLADGLNLSFALPSKGIFKQTPGRIF